MAAAGKRRVEGCRQEAVGRRKTSVSFFFFCSGGLDVRLTEGDIIIVFSQWGEPIDINLVRDKKTGTPIVPALLTCCPCLASSFSSDTVLLRRISRKFAFVVGWERQPLVRLLRASLFYILEHPGLSYHEGSLSGLRTAFDLPLPCTLTVGGAVPARVLLSSCA